MKSTRLIYGKDPWADGEEIALIVLNRNVIDLLDQKNPPNSGPT